MQIPAPGMDKALQHNRLGPAVWENLCSRGSEDTRSAVSLCRNLASFSGAAQVRVQPAGPGRDLSQQSGSPAWHRHWHTGASHMEATETIRPRALTIQGEAVGPGWVHPLRKGKLSRNMVAVFSYLMGDYRQDGVLWFSLNWQQRTVQLLSRSFHGMGRRIGRKRLNSWVGMRTV